VHLPPFRKLDHHATLTDRLDTAHLPANSHE